MVVDEAAWNTLLAGLPSKSDEELVALRLRAEDERGPLRDKFDEARRVAAGKGTYIDPRTYSRMEAQIRYLGRVMAKIQTEQASRRAEWRRQSQASMAEKARAAEAKATQTKSFERRFVDAAQLMLPATLFRDISRAASGVINLVPHPDREVSS